MSYTSFSQKPHFLSRNDICCFCVERGCFSLQTCLFSFPAELNRCLSAWEQTKFLSLIWVSEEKKKKLWSLFCAIALFSLPVCMSHSHTEARVCTSAVALWEFLTCPQFFLRILFPPSSNKKKSVTHLGGILRPYFNLLLQQVTRLTAFMQFGREWCLPVHGPYIVCHHHFFWVISWPVMPDCHKAVVPSTIITAMHT